MKYIRKIDRTIRISAFALSAILLIGCSPKTPVTQTAATNSPERNEASLSASESTTDPSSAPEIQAGHDQIAPESANLMLPVAEGLIRTYEEQGLSYDAQNSACIWWTLYHIAEAYNRDHSQKELTVPEEQIMEYLSAAFSNLAELPDIPAELSAIVTYNSADHSCHFIHQEESIGETRISKAEVLIGSLYEFTVHFSYPDGSTSDYTLNAEDNLTAKNQTSAAYPYAFTSMKPTEYPCTDNC